MNTMRKIFLLFITLHMTMVTFGQKKDEEVKNDIIESRIELFDTEDEEIDYTTLFESLNTYYDHPLNLNTCSIDELRELYLLNDIQINALQSHLQKNGKLLNIYELQTIDGFDIETIQSILPFVKISGDIDRSQFDMARAIKDGKSYIFLRYIRTIEEQKGFSSIDEQELASNPNRRYLGSPDKIYFRYRFKYLNHVSWGITGDKDQGEEFFKGSQKNGFDFYSAHLAISDYGIVKNVIVGDFHAQFGQGLTLWTGQAFGKSIDLLSIKRNARGLRPYTSVDENLFLRGVGATFDLGKFNVSVIGSLKRIDANLKTDTINNIDNVFSSLQLSGFHATPNEIFDKDAIQETVIAGNINYRKGLFSIGSTVAYTGYEGNFERNLGVYNQFEFSTNKNLMTGLDYNWTHKNMNLFGEISRADNGALGGVQGLLIALDKNLTAVALYRHYDRDFRTINNNGVAENSKTINEKGLLLGFRAKFGLKWTLSTYLDRFEFPWLKYQVDAPSQGHEGIVQLAWKPKRGTELYVRYRRRNKPRNTLLEVPIDLVVPRSQNNFRINISTKVNPSVRLKSRVEWTKYKIDGEEESGFLIYQDVIYKALSSPFSFAVRYALFDTDSYNSRIYAYENDVLYYFSIPGYANRGSRYYLSTKYRFSRHLDLWVRWSQWIYNDREEISSGLNEIQDDTKSEIKLQLRYKF